MVQQWQIKHIESGSRPTSGSEANFNLVLSAQRHLKFIHRDLIWHFQMSPLYIITPRYITSFYHFDFMHMLLSNFLFCSKIAASCSCWQMLTAIPVSSYGVKKFLDFSGILCTYMLYNRGPITDPRGIASLSILEVEYLSSILTQKFNLVSNFLSFCMIFIIWHNSNVYSKCSNLLGVTC